LRKPHRLGERGKRTDEKKQVTLNGSPKEKVLRKCDLRKKNVNACLRRTGKKENSCTGKLSLSRRGLNGRERVLAPEERVQSEVQHLVQGTGRRILGVRRTTRSQWGSDLKGNETR